MKDQEKFEFKLATIIVDKFDYTRPKKPHTFDSPINFNIEPLVGINLDKDNVLIMLGLKGVIIETDESILNSRIDFIFEFPDLKKIVEINNEGIPTFLEKEKEKQILATLISISYSTSRGILIEKGSNTLLQSQFLPVIDPMIFLQKKNK